MWTECAKCCWRKDCNQERAYGWYISDPQIFTRAEALSLRNVDRFVRKTSPPPAFVLERIAKRNSHLCSLITSQRSTTNKDVGQRRRSFAIMSAGKGRNKEWSRALDEALIGAILERYPSGRVSSNDVGAIPWDAIYTSCQFPPHLSAAKLRQRLHDTYSVWLAQAVRSPSRLSLLTDPQLGITLLTRPSAGLPHGQARPQSTSAEGAAAGARLQREGRRHRDDSLGQCVIHFVPPAANRI